MSKNSKTDVEGLPQGTVYDLEADVQSVLDLFAESLSLADQYQAIKDDAYACMGRAKDLMAGSVEEAYANKEEAIKDRNFKAGVLNVMRENIRTQYYDHPDVKQSFALLNGTPLLESYKAELRETLKAAQERLTAKEAQEYKDAVAVADYCIAVWKEAKAKADAEAARGRELFESAEKVLAEIKA